MDPSVRAAMEAGFGHSFASVRVHADSTAGASARDVHALAYTVGEHIVFAPGYYRPAQPFGAQVLAHELTHVLQQRAGGGAGAARPQPLRAGSPADPAEREADAVTRRVTANLLLQAAGPVAVNRAMPIGGIARSPASPAAVTPRPVGVYRLTACLAPSELPSITSNRASTIGQIVELFISADYCRALGCSPLTDHFDTNAAAYIAFLGANNPHLTSLDIAELALAATVTGGVSRPDILTHKPPRFEFEEIKPDSVTGRAAGRLKLASLAVLYTRFALPYVPGTTWTGTGMQPLFTLPGGVLVFLEWHRNLPGLVVYNLCVRGPAEVLAAYGILAILIAAALIILSRGRIPGGSPTPMPVPLFARAESGAVPGQGLEATPSGVAAPSEAV